MSEQEYKMSAKMRVEWEKKAFGKGAYVMLHPLCYIGKDKLHPEAGRIGKLVNDGHKEKNFVVDFEQDDLVGKGRYCILPKDAWFPIPNHLVEQYEIRAKKTAYRYTKEGAEIARRMGWNMTDASLGVTP